MNNDTDARDAEREFPPFASYFGAVIEGINEIIEAYAEFARQTGNEFKSAASILLWWRSRGFVSALENMEETTDGE